MSRIDDPVTLRLTIAIIHSSDGIRLLAVGPGERSLAVVADYVAARAQDQLWPGTSRRVDALLRGGRIREAIAQYFANVGERWDGESLHLSEVGVPLPTVFPRGTRAPCLGDLVNR
jgi:hypothetical protein